MSTKTDLITRKFTFYWRAYGDKRLRRSPLAIKLLSRLLFYHDNEARGCFPEYSTLAADSGVTKRAVIKCIKLLVTNGYLVKHRRFNKSNKYFVNWEVNTVHPVLEVNTVHPPVNTVHPGGEQDAPLTHKNPLIEPINREREALLIDSPNEPNNVTSENIQTTFHQNESNPANSHKKPQFPIAGLKVPRGELSYIEKEYLPAMRRWLVSMGLPSNAVKKMKFADMMDYYNDETDTLIKSFKSPAVVSVAPAVAPAAAPAAVSPAIAGLLAELAKYGPIFHEQLSYIVSGL